MVTQYKNLIGGKMVAADRWLDVVNPATEQVIGQVPACGKAELDEAVAAARAAFKTWKNTPIEERRKAIQAIAGIIQQNHEELYRLLTMQFGPDAMVAVIDGIKCWCCAVQSMKNWHSPSTSCYGNLGVQNLETLIGPFLVRTTLGDKKMEDEIIWLCALGTSYEVLLSGHCLIHGTTR